MPPRAAATAAAAAWAACTKAFRRDVQGVRLAAPLFFWLLLRYRGRTKFTVTGTHTFTGTPSLVAGR